MILKRNKVDPNYESEAVAEAHTSLHLVKDALDDLITEVKSLKAMTETFTFAVTVSGIENIDPAVFERLGGVYGVRHAVTNLYSKVMADPELEPYFRGANMARVQYKQADMFLAILGIKEYRGTRLDMVHKHLNISSSHFGLMMKYVEETLEEAGLTEIETQQFTHALIELKPAITGGYYA